MEKDLSAFKTHEELNKFFDNPLIREQIQLTELNSKRKTAALMLKEYLLMFEKVVGCQSIDIHWTKEKGFKKLNILFEEH